MILILTSPDDGTVDPAVPMLRARGAEVLRFDPADFPSRALVAARFGAAEYPDLVLEVDGVRHDLSEVRVIWERRPGRPTPGPEVRDPLARRYVARESQHFLADLWMALPVTWVPAPAAVVQRAQHKLTMMLAARRLGFELPETLIGNDPAALLPFWAEQGGQVISKDFWGGTLLEDPTARRGKGWRRYTEWVSNAQLRRIASLRRSPVIFQRYVEKAVELRVTVFGERVFAAALDSQRDRRTRIDWRLQNADRTAYRDYSLDEDTAARCVALTRELGLRFSTIDLIRTPEGRLVFLELNPSGQWMWVQMKTGQPLLEAMCDLLIAEDRR